MPNKPKTRKQEMLDSISGYGMLFSPNMRVRGPTRSIKGRGCGCKKGGGYGLPSRPSLIYNTFGSA